MYQLCLSGRNISVIVICSETDPFVRFVHSCSSQDLRDRLVETQQLQRALVREVRHSLRTRCLQLRRVEALLPSLEQCLPIDQRVAAHEAYVSIVLELQECQQSISDLASLLGNWEA